MHRGCPTRKERPPRSVHNFVALRAQSATDVRRPCIWIAERCTVSASTGGGCGVLHNVSTRNDRKSRRRLSLPFVETLSRPGGPRGTIQGDLNRETKPSFHVRIQSAQAADHRSGVSCLRLLHGRHCVVGADHPQLALGRGQLVLGGMAGGPRGGDLQRRRCARLRLATTSGPRPSSAWPPPRTTAATGRWPADGGIYHLRDAGSYGSAGNQTGTRPSWAWRPRPTARATGRWPPTAASISFGDAGSYGSAASQDLNAPIVGMAATPDGKGYWEVASDGGIFNFGDARTTGRQAASHSTSPLSAMATTPNGRATGSALATARSTPSATPCSKARPRRGTSPRFRPSRPAPRDWVTWRWPPTARSLPPWRRRRPARIDQGHVAPPARRRCRNRLGHASTGGSTTTTTQPPARRRRRHSRPPRRRRRRPPTTTPTTRPPTTPTTSLRHDHDAAADPSSSIRWSDAAPSGYTSSQMTFDDTFSGSSLNSSNWNSSRSGINWNNEDMPAAIPSAGSNQAAYWTPHRHASTTA